MLIKICGLSTPETIEAAAQAGATHVGLVHFVKSPRHLELKEAAELKICVPERIKTVLLLADVEAELAERAIEEVQPDIVQFHGKEQPDWIASFREKTGVEVWKALGIRDEQCLSQSALFEGAVDRLLFDAPPPSERPDLPGGNGVGFDWSLLKGHHNSIPWGLAGGLGPDNVADAISATGTPLVDASSGLESAPGIKDVDKIAAFCKAALSL